MERRNALGLEENLLNIKRNPGLWNGGLEGHYSWVLGQLMKGEKIKNLEFLEVMCFLEININLLYGLL